MAVIMFTLCMIYQTPIHWGLWGVSAGKSSYFHACLPMFDPWNPWNVRREPIHANCSVAFISRLCHACMSIYEYIIIKYISKQI